MCSEKRCLPNKERKGKSVEHSCYIQPVIMPAVPHDNYPNKEGNRKTIERLRSRTTPPRGCVANATVAPSEHRIIPSRKEVKKCRTLVQKPNPCSTRLLLANDLYTLKLLESFIRYIGCSGAHCSNQLANSDTTFEQCNIGPALYLGFEFTV
jgi:hypothetical protein